MPKSALLVGATGLVGQACLERLLDSPVYDRVTVFARRPLLYEDPKLRVHVVDFERLEEQGHCLVADDIYCCLGTTMQKAKTKEKFRRVDYDYPLALAELAEKKGAKHFLLISSLGADSESIFFYLRVKGELEEKLKEMGFKSLSLLQPSLLLGDRQESRLGEKYAMTFGRMLKPVLLGPLSKYGGIEAKDVAHAMVRLGEEGKIGVRTFVSESLAEIALGKR